MLDDLMFTEEEVKEVQNPQQNTYSNTGSYSEQSNNNNSGWKSNNQQGGGNNWKRKEDVVEDPYLPVSIFIDRDFPDNIKEKLFNLASKFINKGFTVRFNADEPEIANRILSLSKEKTEAYLPWNGFNDMRSKFAFNTLTSKHVAASSFSAWDKLPPVVQAMLARNVRMILGTRNNSSTKCLVTWSPDGASRHSEVTRDTGRASFMISVTSKFHYPVLNIGKEGSEDALIKAFNLQD